MKETRHFTMKKKRKLFLKQSKALMIKEQWNSEETLATFSWQQTELLFETLF